MTTDDVTLPIQRKFPLADLTRGIGGIGVGLLLMDSSLNLRLFFVLMGIANLLSLAGWYLQLQGRNGIRNLIRYSGLACWGIAFILLILLWVGLAF
jgi:hypothetical protein